MRADPSMFENVKMLVKDPAHAVQRFLKRPFSAIPELSDVHSTLITRKDSMTSTVQFSDVLGTAFAQFCKNIHNSKRIRNLQFRKHRFDSTQRPTGRFVLFMKAFIATAVFAATHRQGERDGIRAETFLDYISERRLILLAMMADASDEVSILLRYLDSGDWDMAGLVSEIQQFVGRVSALFLNGQCRHSGYCEHMLKTLQTPSSFICKSGPRSIGGDRVTDAVFQSALQDGVVVAWFCSFTLSVKPVSRFNAWVPSGDACLGGFAHADYRGRIPRV